MKDSIENLLIFIILSLLAIDYVIWVNAGPLWSAL